MYRALLPALKVSWVLSSALRIVMALGATMSNANRLSSIFICFWALRGPYPVVFTISRDGAGALTVTGIQVEPLLFIAVLVRVKTTPCKLFEIVGKLTVTTVLLLSVT